jgi:hypothetical protein
VPTLTQILAHNFETGPLEVTGTTDAQPGQGIEIPAFAGSRPAPRAVAGAYSSYTDRTPPPAPSEPVLDPIYLYARLQGVSVRCFSGTQVYAPFIAMSPRGQLVTGIPSTSATQIIVHRTSGEGQPLLNTSTVLRDAVEGDIVELNATLMPGAYALKLRSTDTTGNGTLRFAVKYPGVIPIAQAVQVEASTAPSEDPTDLTDVLTKLNAVYSQTTAILENIGLPEAGQMDVLQVLAEISAELTVLLGDLSAVPETLDSITGTLLGNWEINVTNKILIYRNALGAPTQVYRLYNDEGQADARKVFKRTVVPQDQWAGLGVTT